MKLGKQYLVYIFDGPSPTVKKMTMSEIITFIKIFEDKYEVIVMDESGGKGKSSCENGGE